MKQLLLILAVVVMVGCGPNADENAGSQILCGGVTLFFIGLFIYGIWGESEDKQCPFCKEYINKGASVCPKCTKEQ